MTLNFVWMGHPRRMALLPAVTDEYQGLENTAHYEIEDEGEPEGMIAHCGVEE